MRVRVGMMQAPLLVVMLVVVLFVSRAVASNECTNFQKQVDGVTVTCSGHGTCTSASKRCSCDDKYGSDVEFQQRLQPPFPKPDCSERVCNFGKAWYDVPKSATEGHEQAECSNAGVCNRETGVCTCFPGFDGSACQYRSCKADPTDDESINCSGHGQCLTLKELATRADAIPLNSVTAYGGYPSSTTWDEDMITSCHCDSSWTVGLASGERQLPEYFGPFCQKRRCPSGNDPMTTADEEDCEGKSQDPISGAITADAVNGGATGNKCHVDCSNKGICDYESGVCACFTGYSGEACSTQDVLAGGSLL